MRITFPSPWRQRPGCKPSDFGHDGFRFTAQRSAIWSTRTVSICRDQPLVLGGIGVALGAVLGAILPMTEAEDRLMGDVIFIAGLLASCGHQCRHKIALRCSASVLERGLSIMGWGSAFLPGA